MFPKRHRLHTPLLKEVMRKGKTAHTAFFIVRFLYQEGDGAISVTIPRKTEQSAVKRNRLKRRIRNIIKTNDLFKKDIAVVLLAKPKSAGASFEELERAVTMALKSIRD